jgi:hypothetical protein
MYRACILPRIAIAEANVAHTPHHLGHTHTHPKPEFPTRRDFLSALTSAAVLVPWAFGQTQTPTDTAERFRQMSEEYEQEGLAVPFRGITTDGKLLPGLFEISPSGVSTEPVRNAAQKFIASLTNVQLARTMFPVDDIQWRKWMNHLFSTVAFRFARHATRIQLWSASSSSIAAVFPECDDAVI